MYDKKLFGESLKELMINNELNATQLGNQLGVAPAMVSNWSLHSPDIKLLTLIKLKKHFNCSIEFLVGRLESDTESLQYTEANFIDSLQINLREKEITEYRLIKDIGVSRSVFHNWKCGGEPRLLSRKKIE